MSNQRKTHLKSLVSNSQNGLDRYMGDFQALYDAYKCLMDEKAAKYMKDKGRSNNPYYLIMTKLQRIKADFIKAYFTNKQFAKINEKSTLKNLSYHNPYLAEMLLQESVENSKTIDCLQNAVDYHTVEDEDCNLYHALSAAVDSVLIYGTPITKVSWNDGLVIEDIAIKDIKFDPDAKSYYESNYLVHDYYKTYDEVAELKEQGLFDLDFDITKVCPKAHDEPYKKHKIQDVYERTKNGWIVSTIAKDEVLRDSSELPLGNPIVAGKIKNQIEDPQGLENSVMIYGDSIIAPVIPIQNEIKRLRNQQLDIVDEILNPRFIGSGVNPFDFTNRKLKVIEGDHSKIKKIDSPSLNESIFETDRQSTAAQEALGVTDYNSGNARNKQLNNTATGISILTSESNVILDHYLRGFNETYVKPLFRLITDYVWAYGDAKFFYGIDRTKELEYIVGVDVGLGATNREMQLASKEKAYAGMIALADKQVDPIVKTQKLNNAEKFYYKEIMPLLGTENYEEYYSEPTATQNNGSIASAAGQPNMGVDEELLGTAESGLSATS